MGASKKQVGRPRKFKKAVSEQDIIDEKKRHVQYVLNKRKENKEAYNTYMRKWKQKKRDDIYKDLYDIPSEDQKTALHRMAKLIKVGCVEKKSKGQNFIFVSYKKYHRYIMETIGFTDEKDVWISRSWARIPLKILKWKDIKCRDINYQYMITYGVLHFMLNIPDPLVHIVLKYIGPDKKLNRDVFKQYFNIC